MGGLGLRLLLLLSAQVFTVNFSGERGKVTTALLKTAQCESKFLYQFWNIILGETVLWKIRLKSRPPKPNRLSSQRQIWRWLNTVFACAFADAIRGHSRNKDVVNRAVILFTHGTSIICVFFSIIERSVLMALVFYYKDILEKVTMQRTQQFSAFVFYWKNPVKCNANAVARKI